MKNQNKLTIFILFAAILGFVGVAIFFLNADKKPGQPRNIDVSVQATVESQGKQVVEMSAKNGFTPSFVTAQANKDTVLKVTTQNTFDCSSVINIPSLGIRQNLPATGSTEIPITAQAAGTVLDGTCSMGMYHFQLKFV